MSQLYNPRYDRGGYGKYNKNKHFISMEAGTDAFYLEDEANESQWIQNELRADLVRKKYYSGIYFKENNDIILSSQIFKDNNKIQNSFLVKPMIANINGYLIDVLGNNGFSILSFIEGKIDDTLIKDLNYIQLPPPPVSGEYYDFVYLEMCFAEIKFSDDLWYLGNYHNSHGLITNDLFDRRINSETNRRIQLKWSINVSRIPANYDNLFDESIYKIYTPAHGAYHKNSIFGFWNAPKQLDSKIINNDIGLWIAGNGLDEHGISPLYTTDGYSYAIPLFKVKRRNTGRYYSANLFGGDLSTDSTTRPDGKFADIIYLDDIIDLRNLIKINNLNKILHTNFENLLLNEPANETKIYSTYFGIDAVAPDADTLLYEGCNKDNFDITLLQGAKEYDFISGVEQEAIVLKNNTYLSKTFNVANANNEGLTSHFIIKTDYVDKLGLYTIDNLLEAYIKNNNLIITVDQQSIIYNFKKHFNKFTHIGIAFKDTQVELIINNKIVNSMQINANLPDTFTVTIGYASNMYANCIFDEIEISNIYENQFNAIPKAIGNDNADLTIDPQLSRKNYTLINNIDTHTFHKRYITNAQGKIDFSLVLPLNLIFTDDMPKVYFDNESDNINANITWQKINNQWWCNITGLGQNIPYNLVIIATVIFPQNQGLIHQPKKAHAVLAEKAVNHIFYAVADSTNYQLHNINYINNSIFTEKDKLFAINPYLNQIGFCTGIKYHYNVNNSKRIELSNHIYMNIIGIYSIIYNDNNILQNYYINNNKYIITLTEIVNDEVEINLITAEYCSLYSPTKSGLLNLYQIEKIEDKGNGLKKEFVYRSNSKIISLLQSKFDQQMYTYAYVNNIPVKVNITINGTFIHYTFDTAPANKADICTYIVSEYDPLRSERLEFIYEIDVNKKENVVDYNNADIIYHENEIFVTTDGYGIYPYQKVNKQSKEIRLKDTSAPYPDVSIILNNNNENNTLHGNEIIDYLFQTFDGQQFTEYIFRTADGRVYTINNTDDRIISTLENDNNEYILYMLNKTMLTLDYLPMTELLKFKLTPVDILASNKCTVIYDKDNYAHIMVKESLPISTNLSVPINYCIPNGSGSFLITFNQLNTKNASETIQGYKNCSIDNKSFYSLTTLDQANTHINIFPFLIKDKKTKLLKMGIFTHLRNDDKICIDINNAALDIYSLNNNYLIKHI